MVVITAEVVVETKDVIGAEVRSVDLQRSSTPYPYQLSTPDVIGMVSSVVPVTFICLNVSFISTVAPNSRTSKVANWSIQQARVVNVQLLGL